MARSQVSRSVYLDESDSKCRKKKQGSTIFQGTIKPSEKHYSGYGPPLSCDIKTHTTV